VQQLAPERVKGYTIDVMLKVRWKSGREPNVDPRDVAGLRPPPGESTAPAISGTVSAVTTAGKHCPCREALSMASKMNSMLIVLELATDLCLPNF